MTDEAHLRELLIIVAAGPAGAFLASRFRVPGGVFVGALIGTAAATMTLDCPSLALPQAFEGMIQIFVGLLVGLRVSSGVFRRGGRVLGTVILLASLTLVFGFAAALFATTLSSMGAVTAFFAVLPGGMAELSAMAYAVGANGASVAAVHLLRVIVVLAIANIVLTKSVPARSFSRSNDVDRLGEVHPHACKSGGRELRALLVAVAMGGSCGLVGLAVSLPAGGVVGAAAGAALVRLLGRCPGPPVLFVRATQVLCAAAIGSNLSPDFLGGLRELALIAVFVVLAQLVLWYLFALLLKCLARIDWATAAVAAAPGGMSEIVAASSLGRVDTTVVALAHLMRLATITVFAPVAATILSEYS